MENKKNVEKGFSEEGPKDSAIFDSSNEYEDLWKEKLSARTREEKTVRAEVEEEDHAIEQKKTKLLEKEMTIKFNPRSTLKWSGIVLLFVLVFFVGRLSVVDSVGTTENADISGTLGSFFGLFSGSSDAEGTTENVDVSEDTAARVDSGITGAVVVEEIADTTESTDEPIVTTYNGVSVAIGEVKTEWKETWGRIKGVSYTIKNMEDGTVEPDYFLLLVEGYGDIEKKIPLSSGSKSIKSKTSASSYAIVPGGFSYSSVTTGDLSSVGITLQLYDAAGKLITATNKMVNLEG